MIKRPYSRHAAFTMDDELAAEIHKFQISEDCVNQGEAVKLLCRIALSSNPNDGRTRGDMLRAFNEVRVWAMNRFAQECNNIRSELQASIDCVGMPLPQTGKGT